MGISVLGEYVIRIYNEVRNRPIHLVARVTSDRTSLQPNQPWATEDVSEKQLFGMVRQINETLRSDVGILAGMSGTVNPSKSSP